MSLHLTEPNPQLAQQQRSTPPGMAHWAGSGPDGAKCGGCKHFMRPAHAKVPNKDRQCGEYARLMKRNGRVPFFEIPASTDACKYFEAAPPKGGSGAA